MGKTSTDLAFDDFCRDPAIVQAISLESSRTTLAALRFAFMAGAKYAIDRCKAEGHPPIKTEGRAP